MNAQLDQYKARLREALDLINQLKTRLDTLEGSIHEPIAVVGMGCRFPGGGEGPHAFWQTLDHGVDAIREIPSNRWPIEAIAGARQEARWAGLLDDVTKFDASFFGISPREAESLDPQQRMLLEITWEALEDGGQRPDLLVGSRTGIFVGISSNDYELLVEDARGGSYDAYCGTGTAFSTAAGRISFALGFQGPAISIDTACSSSLVAIAQACQSLRAGDCNLAIAGGVNAILAPRMTAILVEMQALSPDGRCKTLDARANGFVRGEGCGLLVLKRLSDAIREGDRIRAVIRGWAVNQDGRSTGLTTPNVMAQQAMLRQALASARLSSTDIGYVEMHGTGTSLGDPIEVEALREVLGAPRTDSSSCILGAVKTNVGHLEAAAGAAGIIKVLLALEHEKIPKNLHLRRLNPRISLDGTSFIIPTENVPWPRAQMPRRAGVSSFGISGTNAHIILEEAPAEAPQTPAKNGSAYLLPLSAKSPDALSALARIHAEWFSQPNDAGLYDIIYTASCRRTHHEHRLAILAQTRDEFAKLLQSYSQGEMPAGVVEGRTSPQGAPRVVFVFPGQGSQWLGMGRQLLAEEPAFSSVLQACDIAIQREAGFSILEQIAADESHSRLHEIDVVQPLLFALEIALAALWRHWGIEPDCVVGHSMGEVAAAFVAGILHIEDAAKIICRRSRLLKRISGQGAMAFVELPMAEAEAAIANYTTQLSIGVSNGPRSTVLSGEPVALEQALANLEKSGVFCRRVKVDVASHSPQVDPLLSELLDELADVHPMDGKLQMQSTVTGKTLQGRELLASYWADNLRQPVLFSKVTQDLMRDGHNFFIEMSAHPILLPAIEENLKWTNVEGAAIASMRRQTNERRSMLEALGTLHTRGCAVDWNKFFPKRGRVAPLPKYTWQRKRFWVDAQARAHRSRSTRAHPLLGDRLNISTQSNAWFWKQEFALADAPFLADHRVGGRIIFPGAAYIEIAIAAARELMGEGAFVIEDLSFLAPFVLDEVKTITVEISFVRTTDNAWTFRFSTLSRQENLPIVSVPIWTLHAEGRISRVDPNEAPSEYTQLADLRARCQEEVSAQDLERTQSSMGFDMGPAFRGLRHAYRNATELLGRIELPEGILPQNGSYLTHPARLDAALRVIALASVGNDKEPPRLLARIRRLVFIQRLGESLWSHAHCEASENGLPSSILIFDNAGHVCLSIEGLEARAARELHEPDATQADVLISPMWVPAELDPVGREISRGRFLLFCNEGDVGEEVGKHLSNRGHEVIYVRRRNATKNWNGFEVDPMSLDEIRALVGKVITNDAPLKGIIHSWGSHLEMPDGEASMEWKASMVPIYGSLLHIVQAIAPMAIRNMPRLFLVCHDATIVPAESGRVNVAQSPLWGLGRMVALEYPQFKCTLVDVGSRDNPNAESLVREFVAQENNEQEIALRGTRRFLGRLMKIRPPVPTGSPIGIDPNASYLITGGLGGMGLLGTKWLVEAGARHVVIMDNDKDAPGKQDAILANMKSQGADIHVVLADVANREALATVVHDINSGPHPLKGILHCAAAIDVKPLAQQSMEQLCTALEPRMLGGWNLHLEMKHQSLDFLIFFSSTHALLGSSVLGGDVMGNFFLDALAHYRQQQGFVAASLNWGPVDGVGMSSRLTGSARLAEHGMVALSAEEAAAFFMRAVANRWVQVGIGFIDMQRWLESHPQATGWSRFRSLLTTEPNSKRPTQGIRNEALLDQLKKASPSARLEALEDFLRKELAKILRMEASGIERTAPIRALGIDSLMSLELRNRLETALGVSLPATLVWAHPTTAAMGKHLAELLTAADAARTISDNNAPVSNAQTVIPDKTEPKSIESENVDDDLLKSFDASFQRMRNRRKS